jgi:hypothetical protein
MSKISGYTDKTRVESVYWSTSAFELKVTSLILWEKYDSSDLMTDTELSKYDVPSTYLFKGTLARTIGLNCGLSIELFLKACIIERLGNLPKNLMLHNLSKLAEEAGVVFSSTEIDRLNILTEYITWAGKYPASKNDNSVEELIKKMDALGVQNPECYSARPCTQDQYLVVWNKIARHYSGIGGFGELSPDGEYVKPFKKGKVWRVVLEEDELGKTTICTFAENLTVAEAFILAEKMNHERVAINGAYNKHYFTSEM